MLTHKDHLYIIMEQFRFETVYIMPICTLRKQQLSSNLERSATATRRKLQIFYSNKKVSFEKIFAFKC